MPIRPEAENLINVTFILPALTAGGAERILINLMNGIERKRFRPRFITVSEQGPLRSLIAPDIPFQALGKRRVSRAVFALYSALKKHNPDIVISTMAHMNFAVLLLKPFFPGTKFIVREAITPSYILDEHRRLAWTLKAIYRVLYSWADQVISPAQAIVDEFRTDLHMRLPHYQTLHNFVDVDHIHHMINAAETEKTPEDRPEGMIRFVASGRLHTQKGFDRLIKALPALNKQTQNWRLDILGEGPERPHLESLITQHNLDRHVFLRGFQDSPWPHYAAADCMVLPSRWEGMPNVVLESLACGTQVIATRESGGIHEIAAHAPSGTVHIAETMDEFIQAMQAVTPKPAQGISTSLLPECFEKDTVINAFETILTRLHANEPG